MTQMKLSEAIREGAMRVIQGKGKMFTLQENQVVACALGAAFVGVTDGKILEEGYAGLFSPNQYVRLWQALDLRAEEPIHIADTHTVMDGTVCPLQFAVVNLNDHYDWSFDRIADWLEALNL